MCDFIHLGVILKITMGNGCIIPKGNVQSSLIGASVYVNGRDEFFHNLHIKVHILNVIVYGSQGTVSL